MKTTELMLQLERWSQREYKTVYSMGELAALTQSRPAVLRVQLHRLVQNQVIDRLAQGIYGLRSRVKMDDLVQAIDSEAYVTGPWFLAKENFISQRVEVIDAFTLRRLSNPRRNTSLGLVALHTMSRPIYDLKEPMTPFRALLDSILLARNAGLEIISLYQLSRREELAKTWNDAMANRYPKTVQREAGKILNRAK